MKKFNLAALTLAGVITAALPINQAAAAPASAGTITFKGTITASTCKVDIGGDADAEVQMGKISAQELNEKGQGGSTKFLVHISGCTTSSNEVSTFFNGSLPNYMEGTTGYLVNKATSSAAQNVQLFLSDEKGTFIHIGDAKSQRDNSTYHSIAATTEVTVPYYAEYKKVGSNSVTNGEFLTKVGYSAVYK